MSRTNWRLIAATVSISAALGAYVLQPENLTLFSNPKLVAFIVGGLMVVASFLSNWLPSMTGATAGEKPPAT